MFDFDLIVIGAGPGGYEAALHAAKLGLKTAVVERREVGGTCLNRGCIPTKALLHASTVYEETKNGPALGVTAENLSYDLSAMFAYKQQVVEKLRSGIESLFKAAKVTLLRGTGTLSAPNTVTVAGENEGVYTAQNILLATGSVPARPPIPGLDLPGVMTSDELLNGEGGDFSSLVIIGGGVIGMEFATFYNDLGVAVTVVEGLDRLLPNMDRELGQNLAMIMKKRGVQVFTGAMVKDLEAVDGGLQVNFETKGKLQSVVGEKVLCAIGRSPYTAGLFAEGRHGPRDGPPPDQGQPAVRDQPPRGLRHRRRILPGAARSRGHGPGHLRCGRDRGQGERDGPLPGPRLRVRSARNRRGGPHRGRRQNPGDPREDRQGADVGERPHRDPERGSGLHEAGGPCRDPEAPGGPAHVRQRVGHDLPA